uniref:Uncharacterized protein n=1 Tax=Rhodococcus sp. NS1 TaxID=402236 RepID=A0A097SQI1_9NOCA|nr:hypothetical protein LRS1606.359 [Rhodococcus sp. NS1]
MTGFESRDQIAPDAFTREEHGEWMNQGGACASVAVDEVAAEHAADGNTFRPRGVYRQSRGFLDSPRKPSVHCAPCSDNCLDESGGSASVPMRRSAVTDKACFSHTG